MQISKGFFEFLLFSSSSCSWRRVWPEIFSTFHVRCLRRRDWSYQVSSISNCKLVYISFISKRYCVDLWRMHSVNEFLKHDDFFRLILIGRHFLKNLSCSRCDTENLTTANKWVVNFGKLTTIARRIFPHFTSFWNKLLLFMRKIDQLLIMHQFVNYQFVFWIQFLSNNTRSIFDGEKMTTILPQKKMTTQRKLVFKKQKMTTKFV